MTTKNNSLLVAVTGIAIFLWTLFLFRDALIAAPRADHWVFLDERQLETSDSSFFWNTLSLDRARHLGVVNRALFRPGMHGLLALQDIYLRSDLVTKGLLSLFWHGLVVLLLFCVIQHFTSNTFSALFALALATVYPGKDLVTWRHMSPYLVGLFLFFGGMYVLCTNTARRKTAAILFFLASLFHEIFSISLVIASAAVLSTSWKKEETRKVSLTLFFPAALFLLLNWLNYFLLLQHSASFELASQAIPLQESPIYHFLLAVGFLASGALFPWQVSLSTPSPLAKTIWNFSPGQELSFVVQGVLFSVLLGAMAFKAWQKFRKEDEMPKQLAIGLWVICFLVVSLGLAKIRSSAQSADYLRISPYYLYFGHCLLLPIFALGFNSKLFAEQPRLKRALGAALALWIVLQATMLQMALRKTAPYENQLNQHVSTIKKLIKNLPGFFFAGSLDTQLGETAPPKLFFDREGYAGKKIPLYAYRSHDQQLWLGTLTKAPLGNAAPIFKQKPVADSLDLYLSEEITTQLFPSAIIAPQFSGSWIPEFINDNNFLMVSIHGRLITIYEFHDGEKRALFIPHYSPVLVERQNPITLSVRKFHGKRFLFSNERLLQPILTSLPQAQSKIRAGFVVARGTPLNAQQFFSQAPQLSLNPTMRIPLLNPEMTNRGLEFFSKTQRVDTTELGTVPRG